MFPHACLFTLAATAIGAAAGLIKEVNAGGISSPQAARPNAPRVGQQLTQIKTSADVMNEVLSQNNLTPNRAVVFVLG